MNATPPASPAAPSSLRIRYGMVLLLGIYTLNFLDRQIVNILAEPIKAELHLLDWQLGLMSGLAFALFYTALGLPIARMAERRDRPMIIASAVLVWSAFTALSGTAQTFVHLLLARIGVGVGEAGCTPPTHSLISDYFPREKRASALAFYSLGTPLGGLVGLIAGGLVADAFGWRTAFLLAGAPGLVLAVLAATMLHEPRRLAALATPLATPEPMRFGEALRLLRGKRTLWLVSAATALGLFVIQGHAPFTASFFLRNHAEELRTLALGLGLEPLGFLGLCLGLISGTAGVAGVLIGGWMSDKLAARDPRGYMVAPILSTMLQAPVYILAVSVDSAALGLAFIALNSLLGMLTLGPVYATVQNVVPPQLRATAAAILLFIGNLVGLGLGPLAVGALSDHLALGVGLGTGEGLRWALVVSTVPVIAACGLYVWARKRIAADTES